MFSCLYFNSPPQFHVSNHYNTITSKNKLLRTPRVRTTKYGLNSVKYAGAIQWNKIPLEIRESNSINGFITMPRVRTTKFDIRLHVKHSVKYAGAIQCETFDRSGYM